MRAALLAALLCACSSSPAPDPGPTPAEANEMARIERQCVEVRRVDPDGWSCDFSSVRDARLWEAHERAVTEGRRQ